MVAHPLKTYHRQKKRQKTSHQAFDDVTSTKAKCTQIVVKNLPKNIKIERISLSKIPVDALLNTIGFFPED